MDNLLKTGVEGSNPTSEFANPEELPYKTYLPSVSNSSGEEPSPPSPEREWDPRLDGRGVRIVTPLLYPGDLYWFVRKGKWLSRSEAGGRHHIYVACFDLSGAIMDRVPFRISWPNDTRLEFTKLFAGIDGGNYPMSPSLHEYSCCIEDGSYTEFVIGIGMGQDGNPGEHTSTILEFQQRIWRSK